MPKNKGLGGKYRKKGKTGNQTEKQKEVLMKIPGQEYGQVTKNVGGSFMEILCFTNQGNVTKRGHIRGKMRKRCWVNVGDIVLVDPRDFQNNVCDIVHKYSTEEARYLRKRNQIPEDIDIDTKDPIAEESPFTFAELDNSSQASNEAGVQNRKLDLPPSESDSSVSNEEVDLNKL